MFEAAHGKGRIGGIRGKPIWIAGLSILAVVATLSPSIAAESGAPEAGLYAAMNHVALNNFDDRYNNALSKEYVDGATIMLEWKAIEPQPDVYDWSNLDRWALKAVTLHKKLAIGVIGGWFAPDWLYGSAYGVPKNSFDYNRNPRAVACAVLTQPSFWNPVYLRAYGTMLAALSRHMNEMQGAGVSPGAVYQALRVVKVSGINRTTEELQVDATKADDGPCHQSDAAAIWARAGFTPDKTVSAWMTLAEQTAKAFPDKILSVAIIHRDAFPPINNEGQVYVPARAVPDELTVRILNTAVSVYHRRLLVQWNALSQNILPREVLDVAGQGARVGWQMNAFMGFSSGCVYPPFHTERCRSLADFQSILENGMKAGGRYFEIQPPDASDESYAPAFKAVHDKLR